MNKVNFEDYLQEVHASDYMGTDDDMIDHFGEWLGNMDTQELIDHADLWAYGLITKNNSN